MIWTRLSSRGYHLVGEVWSGKTDTCNTQIYVDRVLWYYLSRAGCVFVIFLWSLLRVSVFTAFWFFAQYTKIFLCGREDNFQVLFQTLSSLVNGIFCLWISDSNWSTLNLFVQWGIWYTRCNVLELPPSATLTQSIYNSTKLPHSP